MIIEDLKESVALKITVADDMQHVLQQSQIQFNEIKQENKQLLVEKEQLLNKYWNAESIGSQMHILNRQLFTEIDNL